MSLRKFFLSLSCWNEPQGTFWDIENFPLQLYITSASRCNQPALKSAADVINSNQTLLQSTVKLGRLAVQLARYNYFGEDAMKISLPQEN